MTTHTLLIPRWRLALDNELLGCRHRAHRRKQADQQMVAGSDALTACRLLVDDGAASCVLGGVEFQRGPEQQTCIIIEDVS